MKKNIATALKNLVKDFNAKNEENGYLTYTCVVNRFMRGGYDIKIEYRVFFSTDFEVLIKFINDNKLNMFLGSYSGENERSAYLSIQ